MASAFDELAPLTGAIQLTPGNHPTTAFEKHIFGRKAVVETRRHHGFDYVHRLRNVWSNDARCLVDSESVHPPKTETEAARTIEDDQGLGAWLEQFVGVGVGAGSRALPLLETMYPDYVLGNGEEIELAMEIGVPLAVDVSHVFIQIAQGVMTESTWHRLADYEHIGEVHLSANDGLRDLHQPLTTKTFGLDWAHAKLAEGIPVVLECYMHRLSTEHRQRQVALAMNRPMRTMASLSEEEARHSL